MGTLASYSKGLLNVIFIWPQNSRAKESNALPLRLRAHGKEDQSSHDLLTCSHVHHMSYHMSQLPVC